jgi:D-3-phosphoglycerate dehydrogenase
MEKIQKVAMTGTVGAWQTDDIAKFEMILKKEAPQAEFELLFDPSVGEDEFIAKAKGTVVLINQFQPMTDKIYKALLPELKGYVANGIGTNAADVPAATKNGIVVANVPDYCQDEVASHAVALILACQRRLPNLARWIADGKWGGGYRAIKPKRRFAGSAVGLYGFGRIPRNVARMLSGFELKIMAHDPYVKDEEMSRLGVVPVSFDQLIEESDYLSLHVPLLPSTEKVINADTLKRMKPNATLINTARGGLVDPQALYDALKEGSIDYAALDVFISEPPSGIEKEIVNLPNVLVTPHVSYYSDTAMEDLMQKLSEESARILRGEKPKNWINPEMS